MRVKRCITGANPKTILICLLVLIFCMFLVDICERFNYELYGSHSLEEFYEHKVIRQIWDINKALPSSSQKASSPPYEASIQTGTSRRPKRQMYNKKKEQHNVMEQTLNTNRSPSFIASTKIPLTYEITTLKTTMISTAQTPDPRVVRCAEVRRRVSEGVVDFIRDYGDDELRSLIKPVFQKKKLVVWSLDHHIGPISDMRSLFEPLGVEFIEHTLYHNCDIMCTCEQRNGFPIFNAHNIIYVNPDDMKTFYERNKDDFDIKRSHAFLVSYSMAILPLYSLFNRSIIAVFPLRYERTLFSDTFRWHSLNTLIQSLASQKRHVIGANNLYDREYVRYFTGSVPDYIPSFCAYTGVHYNPTRMSYLYARRPYIGLGNSWHQRVLDHFKKIRANFSIYDLTQIYKTHEYTDVAAHLGIVHVPYQVSIMMFFEQYAMGIPLFAPTHDFLIHLHMIHYIVYDKTMRNWERQGGSLIPPHSSMNGTYDPNNDLDMDSVRHWLSLSDFYHFPNVTLFDSIENLVEILESMTMTRLQLISGDMMKYNRERLKSILRYWRKRLLDIAESSENQPL